jgi:hypothetical protein
MPSLLFLAPDTHKIEMNFAISVARRSSLLSFILLFASCGSNNGGGTSGPPRIVAIDVFAVSPQGYTCGSSCAPIQVGGVQEFDSSVSGTSDESVSWSLSDPSVPAGTDIGSVNSFGTYTAPEWVSTQLTVTVQATSHADPTKSDSGTVTVLVPTKPILLWEHSPSSGLLYSATFDPQGNLIAGGISYIGSGTSTWQTTFVKYDPSGNLLTRFDNNSWGWVYYVSAIASSIFASTESGLFVLDDSLHPQSQSTCSGLQSPGALGQVPEKLLVAAGGVLVAADPTSGMVDCQATIAVLDDSTTFISSIAGAADHFTVGGGYAASTSCWSVSGPGSGFVGQYNLDGSPRWIYKAHDDPEVYPDLVSQFAVLEMTEGGSPYVYAFARWSPCVGAQQFVTMKFDQAGTKVWKQLWDGGNTQTGTNFSPRVVLPRAGGGLIVVGTATKLQPPQDNINNEDCAMISYDANGNLDAAFTTRQSFDWDPPGTLWAGTTLCRSAVTSNDLKFAYIAGSIGGSQQQMFVAKYALPPPR